MLSSILVLKKKKKAEETILVNGAREIKQVNFQGSLTSALRYDILMLAVGICNLSSQLELTKRNKTQTGRPRLFNRHI